MAVRVLLACMFVLYASILLVQVEVFATETNHTTATNSSETTNITTTISPKKNVTETPTTEKAENVTEKTTETHAPTTTTPAAESTTKATGGVERTLCAASFALYVLISSLVALV